MKVAIVEYLEKVSNYGDDIELIATKITDWEEIKASDLNKIGSGLNYISYETGKNYKIIRFPENQKELIEISIKRCLEKEEEYRKAQEEIKIKEQKIKEKAKERAELKKKMNQLSKEELYKQLKAEFEKQ